jgi:hypothetical protein
MLIFGWSVSVDTRRCLISLRHAFFCFLVYLGVKFILHSLFTISYSYLVLKIMLCIKLWSKCRRTLEKELHDNAPCTSGGEISRVIKGTCGGSPLLFSRRTPTWHVPWIRRNWHVGFWPAFRCKERSCKSHFILRVMLHLYKLLWNKIYGIRWAEAEWWSNYGP